jgi:hypothetical protein
MFLSMSKYTVRGSDSENYLLWLGWYFPAFYGIISLSHCVQRLSFWNSYNTCLIRNVFLLSQGGGKPILTEGFDPQLAEVYFSESN